MFRSYDVTPGLSATTTLDRVQFLLQHTGGIVNCEDELYIGAALGCSLGVMRSKFTQNQRMDEVTAAIRWHAITPAFAGGAILTSTECKEDSFYFDESATWYSPAHGKTVVQSAPCIVARNAPLPTVTGEHLPYVLLSKSPDGNYGIGAIPVSSDVKSTEPPCVSFAMDAGEFLGIFGWFEQVSVTLKAPPKKAYIQSLVRGEARELTLDGDRLTVDLAMLRSLYSSIDGSDSAVAVHFEY